ncbi:hypothetical protein [Rugamonas aquatica]|uniref:Uncharacterized protein n=1 Tax=Rugamonas aquatica TaxID=2743357 RepID=A0A6A7N5D6_9BURK|nr:hypothetical protein [Rugamonas aquatica]MQA40283.1 hypothetical protein [Rugamonas aquatica]
MSSHYLDVAIGLSYTFLAVSLLCSATREAIASLFQTRAKILVDGVLTMLHEPAGKSHLRGIIPSIKRFLRLDSGFNLAKLGPHSLSAAVMTHPLIAGLAQQGRMPSYIPSAIFARAFVSTLTAKYGKGQTAALLLANVGNEGLSRTLLAIMGEGPDDVAALENAVRIWYDTVMDRITGWYKRRSQLVLFCVGLFYAGAMNIDALQLSQRLWRDDDFAAKTAQQVSDTMAAGTMKLPAAVAPGAPAPTALSQAAEAKKDVQALQVLPIGWPSPRFVGAWDRGVCAFAGALVFALMGWIITAFASSLGAPFWFDGIGWLLALRGSGAKPAPEPAPVVIEAITLPSLNGVKPTNG